MNNYVICIVSVDVPTSRTLCLHFSPATKHIVHIHKETPQILCVECRKSLPYLGFYSHFNEIKKIDIGYAKYFLGLG